jgi:hypothetical protein
MRRGKRPGCAPVDGQGTDQANRDSNSESSACLGQNQKNLTSEPDRNTIVDLGKLSHRGTRSLVSGVGRWFDGVLARMRAGQRWLSLWARRNRAAGDVTVASWPAQPLLKALSVDPRTALHR